MFGKTKRNFTVKKYTNGYIFDKENKTRILRMSISLKNINFAVSSFPLSIDIQYKIMAVNHSMSNTLFTIHYLN